MVLFGKLYSKLTFIFGFEITKTKQEEKLMTGTWDPGLKSLPILEESCELSFL